MLMQWLSKMKKLNLKVNNSFYRTWAESRAGQ